jgi:hypothetical protein
MSTVGRVARVGWRLGGGASEGGRVAVVGQPKGWGREREQREV